MFGIERGDILERLKIWTVFETVLAVIAGSLLHFVYQWFGGEIWASIGAVNESTWEHLKLLFWPILLMTAAAYILYGKDCSMFLPARALSVITGMAVIVAVFYTYSGILGYNFLAADIITFVLGVFSAYAVNFFIIKNGGKKKSPEKDVSFVSACALAFILALAALFVIFTYYPPHIGIFEDPVTGYYGVQK